MMVYETFEDELNAIRLAIYDEIKDMTPEEQVAYFNTQAEPIIKEYGLKVVDRIEANEQTKKEAVFA
jgi:cupin superfamily acireductone dioxygenase involved in methionine salvage